MGLYDSNKNILVEDAFRIESPNEDLKALYVKISETNLSSISCANVVDFLFDKIYSTVERLNSKKGSLQDPDVWVVVVDFGSVDQLGTAFLRKYIKYYLNTKLKILNVNFSLSCQRSFTAEVLNSFDLISDN